MPQQAKPVDYDALAKKFGATSAPPSVNYDELAKKYGGVSSAGTGAVDFSGWAAGEPPEMDPRLAALATEAKKGLPKVQETREREAAQEKTGWLRWLKEKGFGPQNIEEAARKGLLNLSEMPESMARAFVEAPKTTGEKVAFAMGGPTAVFMHRMGLGTKGLIEERAAQAARGDVGGALMTTGTEIAVSGAVAKGVKAAGEAGKAAWTEHQVKAISERAGVTPEKVAAERLAAEKQVAKYGRRLEVLDRKEARLKAKHSPEKIEQVKSLRSEAEAIQKGITEKIAEKKAGFNEEYRKLGEEIGNPDVEAFADDVKAASDKYGLRPGEKPTALRWAEEVPEKVGLEEASVFRGMRGDAVSDALAAMKTLAEKNKLLKQLVDDGALTPDEALDYAKGRVPKMGAEGPQAGWSLADVQHIKTALGRTLERADLSNQQRAAVAEAYNILDERMKSTVAAADPEGAKGLVAKHADLSKRYAEFAQDFYRKDSPFRRIDKARDTGTMLRPFRGEKATRALEIMERHGIDTSRISKLPDAKELERMIGLEPEVRRIGAERVRTAAEADKLAEIGEKRSAVQQALKDDAVQKVLDEHGVPSDKKIRAKMLDEFLAENKPILHEYGGISSGGHFWAGVSPTLRNWLTRLAQRRLRKSPAIRERIISGGINLGEPPRPPQ